MNITYKDNLYLQQYAPFEGEKLSLYLYIIDTFQGHVPIETFQGVCKILDT